MGAPGEDCKAAVPGEELHGVAAAGKTLQGAPRKVAGVHDVELHGCTEVGDWTGTDCGQKRRHELAIGSGW